MRQTERKSVIKPPSGFTIIEVLVSFGLFTVVAIIAVSVVLGLTDASRKTHAMKGTMDGLSSALESMTRSIRIGSLYNCNASPTQGSTNDCINGTTFGFVSSTDTFIIYRLNAGRIERCGTAAASCTGTYVALTPPDVTINNLRFYVQGSSVLDTEQPHVTVVINGTSGVAAKYFSNFVIQTTVTQRLLDI